MNPTSSSSPSPLSEEKGGLVSDAYGEDDFSRLGGDEDGYEEEEDENSKQSVGKSSDPGLFKTVFHPFHG